MLNGCAPNDHVHLALPRKSSNPDRKYSGTDPNPVLCPARFTPRREKPANRARCYPRWFLRGVKVMKRSRIAPCKLPNADGSLDPGIPEKCSEQNCKPRDE